MTLDLSKILYTSSVGTFKTTGVFSTSITPSGTIAAGATATFTSTVTLEESQVFAYAVSNYVEFTKGGGARWQVLPTFDAYIETTPIGNITWALYYTINGNVITFTLLARNPFGSTETIVPSTIDINYVTYRLSD